MRAWGEHIERKAERTITPVHARTHARACVAYVLPIVLSELERPVEILQGIRAQIKLHRETNNLTPCLSAIGTYHNDVVPDPRVQPVPSQER